MKRFLTNSLIYIILVVTIGYLAFYYVYHERDPKNLIGYEIYHSLTKALKKNGIKKIIIGDSIGNQAYSNLNYNDSIYSLACNQAISMAGQFLILKEMLDNYEAAHHLDVVVLYRPSSFRNNLDQPFTFNYFLKPFYNLKNFSQFNETVNTQIKKIPFYYSAILPIVKNSRWSPEYMVDAEDRRNDFTISQISAEYLKKMAKLCENKKVKSFRVLCPFMSKSFEDYDFQYFTDQIDSIGLSDIFESYYDGILFLEDSLFVDGSHIENPDSIIQYNYLGL